MSNRDKRNKKEKAIWRDQTFFFDSFVAVTPIP
jgi:hypothetical protein